MPENTQRTTKKAGWHYANRPLVPLPTQSYIQRLLSAAGRLSGGDEENRTPVRKHCFTDFSERSH